MSATPVVGLPLQTLALIVPSAVGRAVLVVVAVWLACADPAAAADVKVVAVRVPPDRYGDASYAYVELRAAAGEANAVTVSGGPEAVVVRDSAAPLTGGAGCRPLGPHEVQCRSADLRLLEVRLLGEDGDDALTDAAPGIYGSLYGGPGDDVLTGDDDGQVQDGGEDADRLVGGAGRDVLHGGAGPDAVDAGDGDDRVRGDPAGAGGWPDVLDGGRGDFDHVGYDGRTVGVAIDLASSGPQGAPGERDLLLGFEQARGGDGADVIRGTDGPNHLEGAGPPGAGDLLDGRRGHDTLSGSFSDDRLEGGPGNDRLDGGGGTDLYRAGAGNDRLSLGLAPFWDPRDQARATVACGPGRDFANDPDARTLVPADCEEISFELIDLRVRRAGPRRLVLSVPELRTVLCHLTVRIGRPGGGRPLARRTQRIDPDRPGPLVLRWRRSARGRLVVGLRGTYRCRPGHGRRLGAFALAP